MDELEITERAEAEDIAREILQKANHIVINIVQLIVAKSKNGLIEFFAEAAKTVATLFPAQFSTVKALVNLGGLALYVTSLYFAASALA
jgi:hypothetical protein